MCHSVSASTETRVSDSKSWESGSGWLTGHLFFVLFSLFLPKFLVGVSNVCANTIIWILFTASVSQMFSERNTLLGLRLHFAIGGTRGQVSGKEDVGGGRWNVNWILWMQMCQTYWAIFLCVVIIHNYCAKMSKLLRNLWMWAAHRVIARLCHVTAERDIYGGSAF